MSYRVTGVGLDYSLDLSRYGSSGPALPSCVPKDVVLEAQTWCEAHRQEVHGLGATMAFSVSNRTVTWSDLVVAKGFDPGWGQFEPCVLAQAKICLTAAQSTSLNIGNGGMTLQCLTRANIAKIIACHDTAPADPVAALAHVQKCSGFPLQSLALPMCASEPSAPVPTCLDDTWAASVDYCKQYPAFNGPKKTMNALCWGASRDAKWYAGMLQTPACRVATVTTTPVVDRPMRRGRDQTVTTTVDLPPQVYTPPSIQPEDIVTTGEDDGGDVDTSIQDGDEDESKLSPMVVGGILLLVLAAAGGVYYYSKRKP